MEPVSLPKEVKRAPRHDWALYADKESRKNVISSIFLEVEELEGHNLMLQAKYARMEAEEVEYEEYDVEDAEYVFIAYGICARICHTAVSQLRKKGIKVGMLRPQTLFPFPSVRLDELSGQVKRLITVELSNGQMDRDVRLAVNGKVDVDLYNWMG